MTVEEEEGEMGEENRELVTHRVGRVGFTAELV